MDPTGFVSVLDIDGISHIYPQLILGWTVLLYGPYSL